MHGAGPVGRGSATARGRPITRWELIGAFLSVAVAAAADGGEGSQGPVLRAPLPGPASAM